MNRRTILILIASASAGAALGIATSFQDGFFGALGIATLLHAMIEPTSPRKSAPSRRSKSRTKRSGRPSKGG